MIFSKGGKLILFADDAVISYHGENINDLRRDMQQDLLLLLNWLSQNKLTLNTQKTKCMLISTNLT